MKTSGILKRILKFTNHNIKYFVFALISSFIGVSLQLLTPIIIGRAIDNIISAGNVDFEANLKIIFLLALTIVTSTVFQWLTTNFTNALTYKTVKAMRTEAFNKLNRLELKYADSHSHGDIITRITTDIDIISDGLLQGFTQLFSGVITILGTLVLMFTINPLIALVVVLLTPISLFVSSFIAKHTHDKFTQQSKIRGDLSGYGEEIISNQKLIKAFHSEDEAQEKFEETNGRLYKVGVSAQFFSALTNPVTRFINGLVYTGTGITGAIAVIKSMGKFTVGNLSCFLTYANQYTKPFNEISGVIAELQNAFASARRVFELLDSQEQSDDSGLKEITSCGGNISIENVSFSYSPDKPLIENFSLDVKAGQKIAIVGPTGCGKTTFINLLMRFYEVNGGSIKFDGVDIRDIKRDSLREQFGMVLQNTWLMSSTIRENLAYAKPDATDEEIIRAAKSAHAHSFIMRLPNGYDTVISENGGNISAGQKQLLCIARVMLKNPPILILDEATSNIDTRTEALIQKAFDEMTKDKTSFVVAHRLSTIRQADVVLVMKDGHIVEKGTHDELIAKQGFYYELYNSQFSNG
ncbi:MAG: ABC transporter ATP-binding protein [Oscillospiraceae bacterium]|nr:ABC transporter ATP-binding protein [Oscillospiraceae bacterium]